MISKVRAKWCRLKAQEVWELRVFEDKNMGEDMTFCWIMMSRWIRYRLKEKKKTRITFLVGAVEDQKLEGGNESNVFWCSRKIEHSS